VAIKKDKKDKIFIIAGIYLFINLKNYQFNNEI